MRCARFGDYTFHVLLTFVDDEGISSVSLLLCFWRNSILDNANLYVMMISYLEDKKVLSIMAVLHAQSDQSGQTLAPGLLL